MSWQNNKLFRYLTKSELRQIAELIEEVEFQKGELLMKENEPGDCFYLIESGEVEIFKEHERFIIAKLGPGENVGLMAVVDDSVRSATVRASTNIKAYKIEAKPFRALSQLKNSKTYYKIISNYLKSQQDYLRDTNAATIEALKKELETAKKIIKIGYAFTFTIVCLAVYLIIARFILEDVKSLNTSTFVSAALILVTSLAIGIAIKGIGLKLRSFGLNFKNWKKAIGESLLATVIFLGFITLVKWLLISYYPPMLNSSLFDMRFLDHNLNFALIILTTYAVFAILQEFIFRGAIQGTLQQVLVGKRVHLTAIILSTLLFIMAHIHLANPLFPIAVIIPGLMWGTLYARHDTLVGVAISHILIGIYAIEILGSPVTRL